MLAALALSAGLVALGVKLERGAIWVLKPVATRLPRSTAENLWMHAIVDLRVVSTYDGTEVDLPVVVVGLRSQSPTGKYTGWVQASMGTTFREGTFLEFGPEHVAKVEA